MSQWLTSPEYFRTVVEAERRAAAVANRLPREMQVFVLDDAPAGPGFWVCFAGWVPHSAWRDGRIVDALTGAGDRTGSCEISQS